MTARHAQPASRAVNGGLAAVVAWTAGSRDKTAGQMRAGLRPG